MKRTPLYRPKPLEMVEIEWSDSYYDPNTDGPPEDYSARVAHLHSVGFFVTRGKDGIVIASCREAKDGTARHFVTIPRVNLKAIHPIGRTLPETK